MSAFDLGGACFQVDDPIALYVTNRGFATRRWQVSKRYREFNQLHIELVELDKRCGSPFDFNSGHAHTLRSCHCSLKRCPTCRVLDHRMATIEFPKKKYFNTGKDVIEKRRDALQTWVNVMLQGQVTP